MLCLQCKAETKNPKFCCLSCQMIHRNVVQAEKVKHLYYKNPKKCMQCDNGLCYKKRKNKFCNASCSGKWTNVHSKPDRKHGPNKTIFPSCKVRFILCEKTGKYYCSRGPNGGRRQISPHILTEKQKYYQQAKFKFKIYDFPKEFNLELLEKHGWYTCPGRKRKNYKKNTKNGISRDHIVSISEGFKNNYKSKDLSHPANCQLVRQVDNVRKRGKSNISYEELKIKIKLWDKKYA